jgi:hypothetical protein
MCDGFPPGGLRVASTHRRYFAADPLQVQQTAIADAIWDCGQASVSGTPESVTISGQTAHAAPLWRHRRQPVRMAQRRRLAGISSSPAAATAAVARETVRRRG